MCEKIVISSTVEQPCRLINNATLWKLIGVVSIILRVDGRPMYLLSQGIV